MSCIRTNLFYFFLNHVSIIVCMAALHKRLMTIIIVFVVLVLNNKHTNKHIDNRYAVLMNLFRILIVLKNSALKIPKKQFHFKI